MWPTSENEGAMTYGEQIRHPSGALSEPEQRRSGIRLWLILAALVALAVFAWRAGWLEKLFAVGAEAAGAANPIANPHGWV